MLNSDTKFVQLSLDDIEVGRPLRWSIYNGDRVQIFRAGQVIPTLAAAEEAFRKGGYRRSLTGGELPASTSPPVKPQELSSISTMAVEPAEARPPRPAEKPSRPSERPIEIGLESARLQIGDVLQLQTMGDYPQRYAVRLIGYLKNSGIIVTTPEVNGALVMVREGQAFIGRFFCGNSAYGFSTLVTRMTSVPYPHLHLSYPRQVSAQVVRKSPRVDMNLIVALGLPNNGGEGAGKLVDLSLTGCGLRTKTWVAEKRDRMLVKFKLVVQDIETVFSLTAEVRSLRRVQDDETMPFLYGLHFCDLDHAVQFALTAYVYGRLLGQS